MRRRLFDGAQKEIGLLPIVETLTTITATIGAVESSDVASISASIGNTATAVLSASEQIDIASFSATVSNQVSASISAVESRDSASFSMSLVVVASLAVTEERDVSSFSVTVLPIGGVRRSSRVRRFNTQSSRRPPAVQQMVQ